MPGAPSRPPRPLRVIVIGPGMSSILAAIELHAAGYNDEARRDE
jgi:monoamine oxidase